MASAKSKKKTLADGFKVPKKPRGAAPPATAAESFVNAGNKRPAADSTLRRVERGERVTAYLPPELAEDLRVRCAKERRSVSDAMTASLQAWLYPVTAKRS